MPVGNFARRTRLSNHLSDLVPIICFPHSAELGHIVGERVPAFSRQPVVVKNVLDCADRVIQFSLVKFRMTPFLSEFAETAFLRYSDDRGLNPRSAKRRKRGSGLRGLGQSKHPPDWGYNDSPDQTGREQAAQAPIRPAPVFLQLCDSYCLVSFCSIACTIAAKS